MDKGSKQTNIILRTTSKEKQQYKSQAKLYGISLTELIRSSLNNQPIKDYTKDKELKEVLENLTREINHIGNNINQATVTLHQLRISGLTGSGEVKHFNELFQSYQKLMKDYKHLLWKLIDS